MARDGGCCETPFSGSAVSDDVDSAVAPSIPLIAVSWKAGKRYSFRAQVLESTHCLMLDPYCKYSDYLEVITVAASADDN